MTYNTIEEIKSKMLLESETQTMSDIDIQSYIDDANIEMTNDINRASEFDCFVSQSDGSVVFYTFFRIKEILEVKVNDVVLDNDEYRAVRNNDGIEIDSINVGDKIEIISIPPNYKMLERAYAIVEIRTRLNPFKNDTVDSIYAIWDKKKKDYLRALRGKFGTGKYSG